MKTSFHIFKIILLALFTISMSDCPDRNGGTESYASGSYRLFFADGSHIGPEDGITGSLTLESDGSWAAKIVFTSPYGSIRLSGTRRDSEYLYVDSATFDGISLPQDDKIPYTATKDMLRYIYASTDYIWMNLNADLDQWSIPFPPAPQKSWQEHIN